MRLIAARAKAFKKTAKYAEKLRRVRREIQIGSHVLPIGSGPTFDSYAGSEVSEVPTCRCLSFGEFEMRLLPAPLWFSAGWWEPMRPHRSDFHPLA